jgi:hypothetical protein
MAAVMIEPPLSLMGGASFDLPVPSMNGGRIMDGTAYSPPRMYQLLELVAERGSGGVVDKVIIAQKSVGELINLLNAHAYQSITKVPRFAPPFGMRTTFMY